MICACKIFLIQIISNVIVKGICQFSYYTAVYPYLINDRTLNLNLISVWHWQSTIKILFSKNHFILLIIHNSSSLPNQRF